MNKEIKDLIEQLNICSVNDYNFEIYGNEAKILKEYISNLQSENKQLKEIIEEVGEYIWLHKYEWGDLEEDNEDFDIDGNDILEILYKVRRSK